MSTSRSARLALAAIRAARTHLGRSATTIDANLSAQALSLSSELFTLEGRVKRLAFALAQRQAAARTKAKPSKRRAAA